MSGLTIAARFPSLRAEGEASQEVTGGHWVA